MLTVQSQIGPLKLELGQCWVHHDLGMFVKVAGLDEKTGEVVLRPEDSIQLWTSKEKFGAGQDCPLQYVTERMAKGSKGEYQEGDLLCNAAWDVWKKMRPHTANSVPPVP